MLPSACIYPGMDDYSHFPCSSSTAEVACMSYKIAESIRGEWGRRRHMCCFKADVKRQTH